MTPNEPKLIALFRSDAPWENGYAESFYSKLRDEFLATEMFEGLKEARQLTTQWRQDYNEARPHGSLGYITRTQPQSSSRNNWISSLGQAKLT